MKVLLAVHQFFPAHGAGTEVLTLAVAKELARRGHGVHVFAGHPAQASLHDAGRLDQFDFEGIPVTRFHHARAPMGDQDVVCEIEYDNHLAARFFNELLAQWKPDVVHFFHFDRLGASLVDVALAAGVRAFYTPTDFWAVCVAQQLLLPDGRICEGPSASAGNCVKHVASFGKAPAAARALKFIPTRVVDAMTHAAMRGRLPRLRNVREAAALGRRSGYVVQRMNRLDRILAPTQLMARTLERHGVRRERIQHMPYGIDLPVFDPVSESPRTEHDDTVTFGFIGTLLPHKGAHVLLQAFRGIDRPHAQLKIYGRLTDDPEYVQQLRQLAEGSRVQFCGTFAKDDLGQVLAEIEALVVPSLWLENTPLVAYAALAARRPVIVSDFPGMTEAVQDGVNGLVVAPGDPHELRGALRRVLDEPALLPRLRQGCTPPKTTSTYVDQLLGLYQGPVSTTKENVDDHHGASH